MRFNPTAVPQGMGPREKLKFRFLVVFTLFVVGVFVYLFQYSRPPVRKEGAKEGPAPLADERSGLEVPRGPLTLARDLEGVEDLTEKFHDPAFYRLLHAVGESSSETLALLVESDLAGKLLLMESHRDIPFEKLQRRLRFWKSARGKVARLTGKVFTRPEPLDLDDNPSGRTLVYWGEILSTEHNRYFQFVCLQAPSGRFPAFSSLAGAFYKMLPYGDNARPLLVARSLDPAARGTKKARRRSGSPLDEVTDESRVVLGPGFYHLLKKAAGTDHQALARLARNAVDYVYVIPARLETLPPEVRKLEMGAKRMKWKALRGEPMWVQGKVLRVVRQKLPEGNPAGVGEVHFGFVGTKKHRIYAFVSTGPVARGVWVKFPAYFLKMYRYITRDNNKVATVPFFVAPAFPWRAPQKTEDRSRLTLELVTVAVVVVTGLFLLFALSREKKEAARFKEVYAQRKEEVARQRRDEAADPPGPVAEETTAPASESGPGEPPRGAGGDS